MIFTIYAYLCQGWTRTSVASIKVFYSLAQTNDPKSTTYVLHTKYIQSNTGTTITCKYIHSLSGVGEMTTWSMTATSWTVNILVAAGMDTTSGPGLATITLNSPSWTHCTPSTRCNCLLTLSAACTNTSFPSSKVAFGTLHGRTTTPPGVTAVSSLISPVSPGGLTATLAVPTTTDSPSSQPTSPACSSLSQRRASRQSAFDGPTGSIALSAMVWRMLHPRITGYFLFTPLSVVSHFTKKLAMIVCPKIVIGTSRQPSNGTSRPFTPTILMYVPTFSNPTIPVRFSW